MRRPGYRCLFTCSRTLHERASRARSAQQLAEDLAGRAVRDLVDEHHLLRALVPGQVGLAVGDDVVLLEVLRRAPARRRPSPPRPSAGGARRRPRPRSIAGVRDDDLLDLGRVHVEARHDDEVLGPVDEEEEPVVVDDGDVAGAQPAVGRERRRRSPPGRPSSRGTRSGPSPTPRRRRRRARPARRGRRAAPTGPGSGTPMLPSGASSPWPELTTGAASVRP